MLSTHVAKAQSPTSCTPKGLPALLQSFSDLTPLANIRPVTMRNFVCSTFVVGSPLNLTNWTTSTRPTGPQIGALGFNTTTGFPEYWNNAAWVSLNGGGGGGGNWTAAPVSAIASTLTNVSGTLNCTTATTALFGCVKPDGTTITISAGVITAVGGGGGGGWNATPVNSLNSTLNVASGVLGCTIATAVQTGCVVPDNTTITITSGVITATGGGGGGNWHAAVVNSIDPSLNITSGVLACMTGSTVQKGCLSPDGTTITVSSGLITSHFLGGTVTNPTTFNANTTFGGATTTTVSGALVLASLPTSCSGQPVGTVWNNSFTLGVCH